jgi:hypothetical protein
MNPKPLNREELIEKLRKSIKVTGATELIFEWTTKLSRELVEAIEANTRLQVEAERKSEVLFSCGRCGVSRPSTKMVTLEHGILCFGCAEIMRKNEELATLRELVREAEKFIDWDTCDCDGCASRREWLAKAEALEGSFKKRMNILNKKGVG